MTVVGQGLENAGHLKVVLVIHSDDLPYWVGVPEVATGGLWRHDDGERLPQCRITIAFDHRDIKDLEEIVVGEKHLPLTEKLVVIPDGLVAGGQYPGHRLDVREVIGQQRAKRRGDGAQVKRNDALLVIEATGYPVGAAGLAVESIIAGLMQDIRKDQQTAGNTD